MGFVARAILVAMLYRTRRVVKPTDLNPRHTLFGGRLLEWLDDESYIYAACQLQNQNLVTKIIGEIDFRAPAREGDIVEFGVETLKVGRTSITMRCEVRNKTTKQVICTINKVVFVCVDALGEATEHGMYQEPNDHQAVS
jgi:acyl-CoA thioesterase YciA